MIIKRDRDRDRGKETVQGEKLRMGWEERGKYGKQGMVTEVERRTRYARGERGGMNKEKGE